MKKSILYIILLFCLFIQCNKKPLNNNITNENNMINKDFNDSLTIEILKNQLKYGRSVNDDFYTPYDFSEKDYKIITPYLHQILNRNGYKPLTNEEFSKKIKYIFKRELDYSKTSQFIFINFLDKCNFEHIFYPNDIVGNFGVLVNKKKNFVSDFYPIPDILDYKKFEGIIEYEETLSKFQKASNGDNITLRLWKDEKNLFQEIFYNEQVLVNRNKYLFNDNKASLAWLKFNDEYFLESLVTTFGYTEDKDLLSWVMDRNKKEPRNFIKENLFVKNCKGNLEIRKDILDYIENVTNNNEHTYFDELARFYYYKEEFASEFTEEERYKMIAYLANTNDYLVMKYDKLGYQTNGRWTLLGSILYNSDRGDGEFWKKLEENFKKNNYYGLPHLKEVTSYAYNYESGSY